MAESADPHPCEAQDMGSRGKRVTWMLWNDLLWITQKDSNLCSEAHKVIKMQGFNMGRYVPPEDEGTTSANKLAGKHALGNRARKASEGILIVRFEMPFAIWCSTCPKETVIGQGVRFNAEKKKVGNYYSSPIYNFRMKHPACGGWIEIRTDPKNTAYVVTEGAKKRDTGDDKYHEGEIQLRSEEEKERLRNDAFAALEVTIDDRKEAVANKTRIDELLEVGEDWDDPYRANQKLRKAFRVERKAREKNNVASEVLKDKMSLGLDLLEESEEDRLRASYVDFGETGTLDEAVRKVQSKPMFNAAISKFSEPQLAKATATKDVKKDNKKGVKRKDIKKEASARERLHAELNENARMELEPFFINSGTSPSQAANGNRDSSAAQTAFLLGLKRRIHPLEGREEAKRPREDGERETIQGLVDYDSD